MPQYLGNLQLLNKLDSNGLVYFGVAGSTSIVKGEIVNDNGSGYATNGLTAFDNTFLGVAAADADNGSGAAGAINVAVIPPLPHYKWRVRNESATVAAQTDIGEVVDLESNDGIDVTDTTLSSQTWGFQITAIDISAKAVAVNTGGYVEGYFQKA